ncbi:MAG: rhomboid family intramembrane serine protease, partial [Bacteroidales bacterium]|nr:rhomboid family intramembrane serine protease [Bacteroidales bacterium]
LFKKKRTIKIKTNNKAKAGYRKESDMEYNARKKAEQDEINAILDKVARSGYGSLSAQEKEKLFSMSSKNQN